MCSFPGSRAELSTTGGLGADSKCLGRGRGVYLWLCHRVIGDICDAATVTVSALDSIPSLDNCCACNIRIPSLGSLRGGVVCKLMAVVVLWQGDGTAVLLQQSSTVRMLSNPRDVGLSVT